MTPAADLFAGLGGFSEGARQTGKVDVLFAANHWADCVDFHTRNHPETRHECQDLSQMDMRVLPELGGGILIAAPACQGFSENSQPARVGTGGNGKVNADAILRRHQADRNTTWAVLAAADSARPDRIVIENVPALLRWGLFDSWLGCLRAMGYETRVHKLNARSFGSAQNRTRVIITAGLGRAIELEDTGPARDRLTVGECLQGDDETGLRWKTIADKPERMLTRMRKAQRQAGARCIWNNVTDGRGRPLDGDSPTLTTKSGSQLYLLDGERCRLLNPRELARIQGFPDSYVVPTNRELASKMIGNAIDVRMARGILEQVVAA